MDADRRVLIYSGIQIGCVIYMLFSGPIFLQNIPFLLIQIFGLLLIGWALLSKRIDEHHHHHIKLPQNYFFVTTGAYEIIRHPIYAGFLLIMSSYAQGEFSFLRLLTFFVLFVVTILKLMYEENVMQEHSKEYVHYQTKTHRLIPYVF